MHSDWQHMPFLAELTEKPWRYSFFQLCRWMDAQSAPYPPLGTATLPLHESLRLGQKPSTTFATREIAEAFHERGRVHVHLFGLGLWGPGGPLPLHLTEEAHERTLVLRDTTLTDFLNIFHHRWLSHFYRGWSMAQAAAGLDRAEEERFSFYISCLAGQHIGEAHGPQGNSSHTTPLYGNNVHGSDAYGNNAHGNGAHSAQSHGNDGHSAQSHGNDGHNTQSHTASHRSPATGQSAQTFAHYSAKARTGTAPSEAYADALPTHARLAAVSHLARRSRNPMGLVATLEHYFGVTVQLEEYCFDWLKLEPEAHCRLGQSVLPILNSHANSHADSYRNSNATTARPLGQSCCLGQDAVLGAYVPDRQCRFALHVGPLSLASYCEFLPGQSHARALLRWVREFVGLEFAFRLHLLLLPEAVPRCTLGGGARLGRTTWLGRADGQISGRVGVRADGRKGPVVHGAVFSPE